MMSTSRACRLLLAMSSVLLSGTLACGLGSRTTGTITAPGLGAARTYPDGRSARGGLAGVSTPAPSTEAPAADRWGILARVAVPKMAVGVAVDPQRQRVFVAGEETISGIPTTIYTLAAATGRLLTETGTGESPSVATLVVDERAGQVLTISGEGHVAVLDATTGALLHSISLGGAHAFARAVAVDARTGVVVAIGADVADSPVAEQDRVCFLGTRRGRVLRSLPVALTGMEQLLVDSQTRRIIVAGDAPSRTGQAAGGRVLVLDEATGRLLRTVSVGPGWFYGLAADDARGHIFVVNSQTPAPVQIVGVVNPPGSVTMLDSRSGALLHRETVGQVPAAIAVDEATAHAFVANALSDTVSVLDTRRGTVVTTVAVGPAPRAVAVDSRAGHVFVAASACPPTYHACFLGASERASAISEVDSRTGVLLRTLPIAPRPVAVAVDADAHRAYIASMGGRVIPLSGAGHPRRGGGPAAESSPSGRLTILDTTR